MVLDRKKVKESSFEEISRPQLFSFDVFFCVMFGSFGPGGSGFQPPPWKAQLREKELKQYVNSCIEFKLLYS